MIFFPIVIVIEYEDTEETVQGCSICIGAEKNRLMSSAVWLAEKVQGDKVKNIG